MASYNEAIESRRTPDTGRFKSLVTLYKASNDYKKLANSTRANWAPWLDRISDYFGELRIASVRPSGKDSASHPSLAQRMGRQAAHGRFRDASTIPRVLLMRLIRSASSRAIHAKESSNSTVATVPKSFGPIPISRRSRRPVRQRLRTRLTLPHTPACALATYCDCHGPTSGRMQSRSPPAKAVADARRSFRFTTTCGSSSNGFPNTQRRS